MPSDLLVVAAAVAEVLEHHGLVAMGRKKDGATYVEFWTRSGEAYRYEMGPSSSPPPSVAAIAAECLALAKVASADLSTIPTSRTPLLS